MIAACLVKRSASRPRTRIIRVLCPFTTPLETIFFLFPAGLRTIPKTHLIRKAFLQKTSITGAFHSFVTDRQSAIGNRQSAIGNRQSATQATNTPSCHRQTGWVRSEHDIGLPTIGLPAIVRIRRKIAGSIRSAKINHKGSWLLGTIVPTTTDGHDAKASP